MGGKNSGPSTPGFVKDAAQSLAERSESIWDLSRPLMETGTGQIAELIRTGGLGANVPIINNAVSAQESAGRLATEGFEGASTIQRRGNIPSQFRARSNEMLRRQTSSAARRIPYQAAAPLIGASATSALTGGRTAQTGLAGAAGALAAGQRLPRRSANLQNVGSNLMLAALYGMGGGFGSTAAALGGGKSPYPGMWQVGGPTTIGPGGSYASAPGIMLEF